VKRRVDDLSQKGPPDASAVSLGSNHLQVLPPYHQGRHKRDPSADERVLQDGIAFGLLGMFRDVLAEARPYYREEDIGALYVRFIKNMVPGNPDTPTPRSFKDVWGERVRLWTARGIIEEIAAVVCSEGFLRLFTRMDVCPATAIPQEKDNNGVENESQQRRTCAGYVAADGLFSQSIKEHRRRRFIGPPLR